MDESVICSDRFLFITERIASYGLIKIVWKKLSTMFISTTIEKDRNRRSGISFKLSNCKSSRVRSRGWSLSSSPVVLGFFFLINVIQTFCGCWMNPPNTLGRISFPTPHPLHRIGSKKSKEASRGGVVCRSWSWVVRGKSCSSRARREYQSIETPQVVVLQKKRKRRHKSPTTTAEYQRPSHTRVQSPDSWETDVRSTSFSNDNSPEGKKEEEKKKRNKRDFGDSSRKS